MGKPQSFDPDPDSPVRRVNASIAGAYDQFVYEAGLSSGLRPDAVLGLSALYGAVPPGRDVLDLGCGTGLQLEAAGDCGAGRLVGVDLSREAVARARARCGRFGERARIEQADILDLDAADLGRFDMIYSVGVFYVAPREVRRKTLDLISRCLKPGGVVVISHYAGTSAQIRVGALRLIRALDDPALDIGERLARARRHAAALLAEIPDGEARTAQLRGVLKQLLRASDGVLFHEAFDAVFDVLDAHDVAKALAGAGVQFLSNVNPSKASALETPLQRVMAVARDDLVNGGYRYSVYGRLSEPSAGIDVASPHVRWTLNMRRAQGEDGRPGWMYRDRTVIFSHAASEAAIGAIGGGALGWDDLRRVALAAATDGQAADTVRQLKADLRLLWITGAAVPLRAP